MALSSAIQWEIRQGGSDTNGGGFKAGASGTDWTLQDSPQYSVTDGVTAGSTTITSATANFGTDVVGNCIYVQGGTGSVAANWYEITARTNSTTITVDRSTGLTAGTGVTLKIGGAFGTPGVLTSVSGGVGGQLVNGHKAWVKYNASPFSLTTSTAGPAGPCSLPSSVAVSVEGYETTRGDLSDSRPVYKWGTNPGSLTYAYVANGSARQAFINLAVDGDNANSRTNVGGFNVGAARTSAYLCSVAGCGQSGCIGFLCGGGHAKKCFATGCTTGFSGAGTFSKCTATGGTTGFSGFTAADKCLAYSVPTGFSATGTNTLATNCTADSCTTAGFVLSGQGTLDSCLATNCTGSGVGFSAGTNIYILINCAYYNNTTNISGTPLYNTGAISLSADPYVNQASADFRPNTTAGGGAALRAAGIGVYGQTDSADVGAVQHTDPAGGGLAIPVSGRICA